mgnify:CR=1 FL=1
MCSRFRKVAVLFVCVFFVACDVFVARAEPLDALREYLSQNSNDIEVVRRKAQDGDAEAQFNMGRVYDYGESLTGIPNDYAEAFKWYRLAAEQNYHLAQHNLALMYDHGKGTKQNKSEAVRWWTKAAENGDLLSQYALGYSYMVGDGVKQNKSEGAKWWMKAAESGNAQAQYSLGCMYDNGDGVEQDSFEAVKWYRKAAEQNYARAQFMMGVMYYNG